ncbi:hypothetical protein EDC30_10335 [Paucimonas lemoignei]|uniref:Uncharacterized protein n=1 Tax=Paucimonas lemoignei TaxID=29443 RepID=A0A4R3HYI9_PAULE|nr:hypothetical protein [Paucimonas lemoignei]TCS37743.1 hypothetical protein EDC30_10335 [Paucimonas lemoignei]
MLAHATPSKPAPFLGARGIGLRLHVGPTAFGNALGNSLTSANWGGNGQQGEKASTWDANKQAALDRSITSPGYSEEDYWNSAARTTADQYVDTYGGEAINTRDRLQLSSGSINGVDAKLSPSQISDADIDAMAARASARESLTEDQKIAMAAGFGPLTPEAAASKVRILDALANQAAGESDRPWTYAPNTSAGPTIANAKAQGIYSGDGWVSDFVQGYRFGNERSVMDGPERPAEAIGRYTGDAVTSFGNFFAGITGKRSMDYAVADWNAGNYGRSVLHGMQSFGEAGMTVFGFGVGSTRYGVGMTAEQYAASRATYVETIGAKGVGPSIEIAPYGEMVKTPGIGQAHHLNQDAVFKSVIKTNDGLAIRLEGNAFTEIGSPHYNAHRSLERFYNQFRKGGEFYGEVPTNLQYSKALLNSLQEAGLARQQALEAVRASIGQRVNAGQLGGLEIPRIPNRINQVKPGGG